MKTLLVLIALLIGYSSSLEAKIKVGVTHWVDFTNPDETGVYIELLKEIYKDEEISFEFTTYNRMIKLFESSGYDFVVGVTKEDVPKAHYPIWHLDYDYPINAYFLKSNKNITALNDLQNKLLSWFHGYGFDKYIEFNHDFYAVDTIKKAMTLLSTKRIDAFIDYDYNIPNEYKKDLSHVEVLPARPIYLAFSSSIRGKQLANIYDSQMVRLRNSGKLKQIYKADYAKANFDESFESRTKVVISTSDESLLRLNSKNIELSLEAKLYKQLLSELPQYRVEFVKANSKNDEKQFIINNCFANKVKTEYRTNNYLISSPFSMYMSPRLFSRYDLNKYNNLGLVNLLAKSNLKLGLVNSRELNSDLKRLVSNIDSMLTTSAPSNTYSRFKALNEMKGFQVSIEYPDEISTYWHKITDAEIYSIELPIEQPFTLGHLMCKKSETNQKFIADFNLQLKKLIHTDSYFNDMRSAAKGISERKFELLYQKAFHY